MPAPWNLWMKTGFCRRAREGIVIRQSAQRLLRGAASPAPRLHALSTARHSARRIAGEIGRASCRERGCTYVYISVVAVSFNKKKLTYGASITQRQTPQPTKN